MSQLFESLAKVHPIIWGLLVCAIGLAVALGSSPVRIRRLGYLIGAAGLIVLAIALPKLSALTTLRQWLEQVTFWLLAGAAVICSVAAICSRNPVYTAIWFAGSLLGVGGLFLYQNAQFLGVATIVVYAGAIVVTFLFVLMLANPEGHANYDRISWAKFPMPLMVLAAAAMVAFVATSLLNHPPAPQQVQIQTVGDSNHTAQFGGELFARHMVSVEIVGTILLVALVGAVAIVIHGKEPRGAMSSIIESTMVRRDSP